MQKEKLNEFVPFSKEFIKSVEARASWTFSAEEHAGDTWKLLRMLDIVPFGTPVYEHESDGDLIALCGTNVFQMNTGCGDISPDPTNKFIGYSGTAQNRVLCIWCEHIIEDDVAVFFRFSWKNYPVIRVNVKKVTRKEKSKRLNEYWNDVSSEKKSVELEPEKKTTFNDLKAGDYLYFVDYSNSKEKHSVVPKVIEDIRGIDDADNVSFTVNDDEVREIYYFKKNYLSGQCINVSSNGKEEKYVFPSLKAISEFEAGRNNHTQC